MIEEQLEKTNELLTAILEQLQSTPISAAAPAPEQDTKEKKPKRRPAAPKPDPEEPKSEPAASETETPKEEDEPIASEIEPETTEVTLTMLQEKMIAYSEKSSPKATKALMVRVGGESVKTLSDLPKDKYEALYTAVTTALGA